MSSTIIISGLSGSGKTIALRALEDLGFFCVDNLIPQLIDPLVSMLTEKQHVGGIAIGIDIREKDFLASIQGDLPSLCLKYGIEVVFLEAETDVLLRRFKETRRPHPLMSREVTDIVDAITMEKGLLIPLRDMADKIIDTSPFTPHQLRQYIVSMFSKDKTRKDLNVTVMSFGFKFGVPQNADLIFDVRFLPNPHFVPHLKDLDGRDPLVKEFVLDREGTKEFLEKLGGLLRYLIPLYIKEGKAYLTIGIGCTGGKHRSAAIAQELASIISDDTISVNVVHRDL